MLKVAEALCARNEIVGLLADRVVAGDKLLRCWFLDAAASFPEGPFILASVLNGARRALFRGLLWRAALSHQVRNPLLVCKQRRTAAARRWRGAVPALRRLACAKLPGGAIQLVQLL